MTKEQLQARRKAIHAELTAISEAVKLGGRGLTDDERTRIKTLSEEDDKLKEKLAAIQADEETLANINGRIQDAGRPQPRRTTPDPTDPTVPADVKKPAFATLGHQLQAIAHAGMHGDHPESRDPRLKWEALTAATGAAQATVPSDGGYLIQKDFATQLITRMHEIGQIKNRVRTIPIGADSDGLKIPAVDETSRATGSRWGGVQMYWGAENDAATAKKPKLRMMELELKDLIGLAYASNRLLRDASAMQEIFLQAFSEETVFMIEDALINGGAGMPLGVLGSSALVSVSKEAGQAGATIVKENVDKMWGRLWGRSRPNAAWLVNQDCEQMLASMKMDIGTGGVPVYLPPGGLSESPYATLKGRPVIPLEYCATLGTVGDIMLVDFTQVIAIEKDQMQADSSIHVRFATNENTFRFIYRYDAQPVWNSALTPFKGSNTQSPYVALATRS